METNSENSIANERELTFGEKLVGLKFNPSGDERVNQIKKTFADLTDSLKMEHDKNMSQTNSKESAELIELRIRLYNHAVGEILNAQMSIIKVLTF